MKRLCTQLGERAEAGEVVDARHVFGEACVDGTHGPLQVVFSRPELTPQPLYGCTSYRLSYNT